MLFDKTVSLLKTSTHPNALSTDMGDNEMSDLFMIVGKAFTDPSIK
jgi:hypothetical protein